MTNKSEEFNKWILRSCFRCQTYDKKICGIFPEYIHIRTIVFSSKKR